MSYKLGKEFENRFNVRLDSFEPPLPPGRVNALVKADRLKQKGKEAAEAALPSSKYGTVYRYENGVTYPRPIEPARTWRYEGREYEVSETGDTLKEGEYSVLRRCNENSEPEFTVVKGLVRPEDLPRTVMAVAEGDWFSMPEPELAH